MSLAYLFEFFEADWLYSSSVEKVKFLATMQVEVWLQFVAEHLEKYWVSYCWAKNLKNNFLILSNKRSYKYMISGRNHSG